MAGNDNTDANPGNIFFFTLKDKKLFVSIVTLSAKTIKNYQNVLTKDLKDQFIEINLKQKVRINTQQVNIFSNQTL